MTDAILIVNSTAKIQLFFKLPKFYAKLLKVTLELYCREPRPRGGAQRMGRGAKGHIHPAKGGGAGTGAAASSAPRATPHPPENRPRVGTQATKKRHQARGAEQGTQAKRKGKSQTMAPKPKKRAAANADAPAPATPPYFLLLLWCFFFSFFVGRAYFLAPRAKRKKGKSPLTAHHDQAGRNCVEDDGEDIGEDVSIIRGRTAPRRATPRCAWLWILRVGRGAAGAGTTPFLFKHDRRRPHPHRNATLPDPTASGLQAGLYLSTCVACAWDVRRPQLKYLGRVGG